MIRFLIISFSLFLTATVYGQRKNFPYNLDKKDLVISSIGLSFEISSQLIKSQSNNLTSFNISNLNPNEINSFDRKAINNWKPNHDKLSNKLFVTSILSSSIVGIPQLQNKNWKNSLTLMVIYSEALLLTYGGSNFVKSISKRNRPYLYNSKLSIEQRFNEYNNDNSFSFFSRQTALAFCSATFLSSTFTQIYGRSLLSNLLWITSHSLASTVGILRVSSGQHYYTDVLTGTFIGSFIGYIIPKLHNTSNEKVSVIPSFNGITICYSL